MKKPTSLSPALFAALALAAVCSCVKVTEDTPKVKTDTKKVGFDISVTREGQAIDDHRRGVMTKSGEYDENANMIATMDKDIPFGLVGIDYDHHALVVDNARVESRGSDYGAYLNSLFWEDLNSETIHFSAYYPYVKNITYGDTYEEYRIPYSIEETDAGPLVSKTVEMAVNQLNIIPLQFQHITNDIGYRICDITPDESLQGLIRLRKLTAYKVASAGVFVNDVMLGHGIWHRQGYYRDVVVFEGNARVGVGSENEKFVGFSTLEDHMVNSHRYYAIPDEILMGRQYVEAVYDVDEFTIGGFKYNAIEGVVARYPLYGVLPDNVFVYGKQYTFHIGLDLRDVYKEISFAASVEGWETKIYENNDDY